MSDEIIPAFKGLSEQTYHGLIQLWMSNFRENLPKIWKNPNISNLPKRKGEPVIIVGAGPSLTRYRHLAQIAKAKWKHPILVCDRIFIPSLKHKLKPYTVASVDGSPLITKYYKSKLVEQRGSGVNAVFAVTVHPDVVKAWKRRIYWFVPMLDSVDQLQRRSISYILCLISKHQGTISGIGNVGSFNWNLATELGCSPIILVGYDFSEQVKYKEHGVYWNSFVKLFLKETGDLKKAKEKAALLYQVEKNPDFNRHYLVNPIWKGYRNQLMTHIVTSGIHTVQATGNGCIHTKAVSCPNFEAMPLKKALRKFN